MVDTFKAERIPSTYTWEFSPEGQHLELGIAEIKPVPGAFRALAFRIPSMASACCPIGTVYDPFIYRGADH